MRESQLNVDYDSFTEEEKRVMDQASETLNQLYDKGLVKPNAANSELLDVDASDAEHEVLMKAVEILEKHAR